MLRADGTAASSRNTGEDRSTNIALPASLHDLSLGELLALLFLGVLDALDGLGCILDGGNNSSDHTGDTCANKDLRAIRL